MDSTTELITTQHLRTRVLVKRALQQQLHHLLITADVDGLDAWLEEHPTLINFYFSLTESLKMTPLIVCVMTRQYALLNRLLSAGANPALPVRDKSSQYYQLPALAIAGLRKDSNLIECLLRHNAPMQWPKPQKNHHYHWIDNFLSVAIWGNDLTFTQLALSRSPTQNYAEEVFALIEPWHHIRIDVRIVAEVIACCTKLDVRFAYRSEYFTPLGLAIIHGRSDLIPKIINRLQALQQNIFKSCIIRGEVVTDEKHPYRRKVRMNPVSLALMRSQVDILNTLVHCGVRRSCIKQIAEFYLQDDELDDLAEYDSAAIANLFNNCLAIGFFCFQQRQTQRRYFFEAQGVSFANAFLIDFSLNDTVYTQDTRGCAEAITCSERLWSFCQSQDWSSRMDWLLFFTQQMLRYQSDHLIAQKTANVLLHSMPAARQNLVQLSAHQVLVNPDLDIDMVIAQAPDQLADQLRLFI